MMKLDYMGEDMGIEIWLPLLIISALLLLFFITLAVCYIMTFYSKPRKMLGEGEYEFPEGSIYEPYHEKMKNWMDENRRRPHEDFEITSYDGLKLRAKYFEYRPGAIIELIFHGYRGNSERDLCAAVERCAALGRSVMLIDQRASGWSDGSTITFGIKERHDVVSWANFAVEHFGPDVRLILGGVSMGAATVLLAAAEPLPDNVLCIMGDCGFDTARGIIQKVIGEMHLPPRLMYPFVRLAGIIFGGFDLDETSPIESVKKSKTPIIFIHGDNDDFVPHTMSERMYEVCPAPKKLAIIHGAGVSKSLPVINSITVNRLFSARKKKHYDSLHGNILSYQCHTIRQYP